MPARQTSFLFDLDGTLVDSVYQHVLAWHEALEAEGIELSVWRIHRRIGMSGGLFANMLFREIGLAIEPRRIERLRELHAEAYNRRSGAIRPLPGARSRRWPPRAAAGHSRWRRAPRRRACAPSKAPRARASATGIPVRRCRPRRGSASPRRARARGPPRARGR